MVRSALIRSASVSRSSARHLSRQTSIRIILWVLLGVLAHSIAASAQKDFYRTLGVRRDAGQDEIKRAYRELAKKHHPDKNKNSKTTERFVEIQKAHDILSDPQKRKMFDQTGSDPDDPEVQQEMQMRERRQRFRRHDPVAELFFGRYERGFQPHHIQSQTQTLTRDSYDAFVSGGESTWIVQVWRHYECQECVRLAPIWDEAAKELQGVVHFGRINYDRQMGLVQALGLRIRSLPYIVSINRFPHLLAHSFLNTPPSNPLCGCQRCPGPMASGRSHIWRGNTKTGDASKEVAAAIRVPLHAIRVPLS